MIIDDNAFRAKLRQHTTEILNAPCILERVPFDPLALRTIDEKIAGMACKASVKGGDRIGFEQAEKLIDELLTLDNPYNCPHGRPTIISITKTEMEKKFKRIVD